jgi:hypothetical protein
MARTVLLTTPGIEARPPASSSGPLARTARQPEWRAKSPAGEPFGQWFGPKVVATGHGGVNFDGDQAAVIEPVEG